MTEQRPDVFIRGLILSFEGRSLTFLHSDDSLTIYTLTEDLRVRVARARSAPQEPPPASERIENHPIERPAPVAPVEAQRAEDQAKKTVVLSGVCKGAIRVGRPDKNGKPTVWHLGAMHVEGEEQAVMMLISHYLHAATLATEHLRDGAQFTAEGYLQPPPEEGKRPRLNVFHLVNYPDKTPQG